VTEVVRPEVRQAGATDGRHPKAAPPLVELDSTEGFNAASACPLAIHGDTVAS
jgi:hypothetical protein